jgi:DNA-binding response OmpR family regulator
MTQKLTPELVQDPAQKSTQTPNANGPRLAKLLVVDDEASIRRLMRLNLGDKYDIIDTGEPETALSLALEHKPDAILLDLRMPKYSGYELCQTFTTFSSTKLIPVLVISGEAGSTTKSFCRDLGVTAYFEKPVDFDALEQTLSQLLSGGRKERRSEIRVKLRVPVRISGQAADGSHFDILTMTENVSQNGFLAACNVDIHIGSLVEVSLTNSPVPIGQAKVMRSEWQDTKLPRYGCRFTQKPSTWVLQ